MIYMFLKKKTKNIFLKNPEWTHRYTDKQKDIVIKSLITQEYLASLFFLWSQNKTTFLVMRRHLTEL